MSRNIKIINLLVHLNAKQHTTHTQSNSTHNTHILNNIHHCAKNPLGRTRIPSLRILSNLFVAIPTMLLDRTPPNRINRTGTQTVEDEEIMTFIIEHLEPKVYPWCVIEYKHISKIVGKKNLWITNVAGKKLEKFANVFKKTVTTIKLEKACVLDPNAEKELSPKDDFEYFVFGGILGDNPPRARTHEVLRGTLKNAERRSLGKEQMATDNAVYVVKEIMKGTMLSEIKFVQDIEIPTKKGESVLLPYKYVIVNGKPLICKELERRLKKQRGF